VSCSENRPFYGEILKLTNQSMGISLHRPYIGLIYGRYLQFRILEWPLNQYMISGWVCAIYPIYGNFDSENDDSEAWGFGLPLPDKPKD
jgi:hypothetical protein